jgi:hypothetical protein
VSKTVSCTAFSLVSSIRAVRALVDGMVAREEGYQSVGDSVQLSKHERTKACVVNLCAFEAEMRVGNA